MKKVYSYSALTLSLCSAILLLASAFDTEFQSKPTMVLMSALLTGGFFALHKAAESLSK